MRIGIWCGYGKTLTPSAGIGVFTHNLARAVARQGGVEQVVLAVHRWERAAVAETVLAGAGRIAVVEIPRESLLHRWRRKRLIHRHRRLSDQIAKLDATANPGHKARLDARREQIEQAVIQVASAGNPVPADTFARCDVWLLPHVAVHRRFASASIVIIHDMVPLRYRGVIRDRDLESFRRRAACMARDATLVGCMSQVIRDEDVVGLLGCDPERVRVVYPAVPDDFPPPCPREHVVARWPWARERFLLYPADFRPYKNHERLVEALKLVRQGSDKGLHLVCTGGKSAPRALRQTIARAGLSAAVHVIGRVERDVLARLYCEATATIVPSLYEQGSFPLLEAMRWGCPVATSDIPSLREAFASMGDAMNFFDPGSETAIAAAIAHVVTDAEAVRARQKTAFERLRARTWADVAREWLAVCDEAIRRHRS